MVNKQGKKPVSWGQRLTRENRDLREKLEAVKTGTAALERDLRNTSQLIETLPGGVILVEKQQIVFANEAACEALGYEKQALLEMNMADLVHSDSDALLSNFSITISPGDRVHDPYEVSFVRKNGSILLCAVGLRAIRRNRKKVFLINMVGIEQIRKKERVVEASLRTEAVKRVITGCSKQMEASILFFEKLIGRFEKGETGKENRGMFSEGIENLRNMSLPMGREFWLIARDEYDVSEMGVLVLREVIENAEVLSRGRVFNYSGRDDGGFSLKKYLRAVSPASGCKAEMEEALACIIQNAMEAVEPGGEIYVTSEESSGFAFVYVQDNGAGVHADVKDNMYEPFVTTKNDPYRGLGLSVAHAVVARHGGKLDVISRDGQGTTVAVRLPLAEKGATNRTGAKKNWIKDHAVLLISSENMTADLFRLLFADRGGRVTVVSGEKEAAKELRKKTYDLLIINWGAKPDRAVEIVQTTKKLRPELAIVLVNTGQQNQSRQVWERMGVDFIAGRPLNMDLLFSLLSKILKKKGER